MNLEKMRHGQDRRDPLRHWRPRYVVGHYDHAHFGHLEPFSIQGYLADMNKTVKELAAQYWDPRV